MGFPNQQISDSLCQTEVWHDESDIVTWRLLSGPALRRLAKKQRMPARFSGWGWRWPPLMAAPGSMHPRSAE